MSPASQYPSPSLSADYSSDDIAHAHAYGGYDSGGGLSRRAWANNTTRVPQIWVITFLMFAAATTFVAARIYVRRNIGIKSVGVDDFMIFLALIATSTCGAIGLWGARLGFGKHVWDILNRPAESLYELQIVVVLIPVTYQLSLACVQLSILSFYARFIANLRFSAFILMGIVVIFCVFTIAANVIHCRPKPEFQVSVCANLEALWYFSSGVGLFLDILIWSMPLPKLLKLKSISYRKKVAIVSTFCVGGSAVIVSISRMMVIAVGATNDDKYWNMARLHIYNQVEVGFGIACACMPSLMPLLRRFLRWKRGDEGGRKRKNRGAQPPGPGATGGGVFKDNGLDSTFAGRGGAGESVLLNTLKSQTARRERRHTHISVAEISGCGILDSPLLMPAELCAALAATSSKPPDPVRRVGGAGWIELSAIPPPSPASGSSTPHPRIPSPHPPEAPAPAPAPPNNRVSTGSIPGAKLLRRASSRLGDFFRPFSLELPRASAPANPADSGWGAGGGYRGGNGNGIKIEHAHQFPTSSTGGHSVYTPPPAPAPGAPPVVTRPLRAFDSGEVVLLVRPSRQGQRQQQQDDDNYTHTYPQQAPANNHTHNHIHNHNQNPSTNTVNTLSTTASPYTYTYTYDHNYEYTPSGTPSTSTSTSSHTHTHTPTPTPTPPSPRQPPWRDSIYPNPVEDQRGMLGLGDVDPVAGGILQLERTGTRDSSRF